MRPGDDRGTSRAAAAEWDEPWAPLLEILRSADSAVGAAVHWVESQGGRGGSADTSGGPKRRKGLELWRFVPELLSSQVVYVEEEEEAEEDEAGLEAKGTPRAGGVGNCIWLQTLPSAMQANILTFLNAEHEHFHAKDLETLARRILSSSIDPEFWQRRAAMTLLGTALENQGKPLQSISTVDLDFTVSEDYDTLPDWLQSFAQQQSGPFSSSSKRESLDNCTGAIHRKANGVTSGQQKPIESAMVNASAGVFQEEAPSVRFPVPLSAGSVDAICQGTEITQPPSPAVEPASSIIADRAGAGNNGSTGVDFPAEETSGNGDADQRSVVSDEELRARDDVGSDEFERAVFLRQALHSCQGNELPEEICLMRSTTKLSSVISIVRPWEVDDEVTLLLTGSLLTDRDGYTWSTQILRAIFLQKLKDLEKPASRILVTAVVQAGKTHPTAAVDSIVLPLISSENGASNFQCDLLNRIVKDCLPEKTILTLGQKIFAAWDPQIDGSRCTGAWLWTEGMVTVVHNILGHRLNFDQQTVAGLVCALNGGVAEHATSLKFANLLLNLFSKYGSKLQPHKAALLMVANRSNTFLTKSLLTKLAAIEM